MPTSPIYSQVSANEYGVSEFTHKKRNMYKTAKTRYFMNPLSHFTLALQVFLLSFLLFGICPASEKQPATLAHKNVAGWFVTVTPISETFQRKVAAATETIPSGIWIKLQRKGWRFRLAEFVVDAVPSLKNQHPRGWPYWMTWEHVDGVNIVQQRLLAFSEQRRDRSGRIVANVRIAGVIRHEVGHAFDATFSGPGRAYSATPRFRSRYERAVQRMSAEMRGQLQ